MSTRIPRPLQYLLTGLLSFAVTHAALATGNRRRPSSRAVHLDTQSAVVPLPLVLTNPVYYNDLLLYAHTTGSYHIWQETFSDVALTRADADGQAVGQIDDPSLSGHLIQWSTLARDGVLRTEAGTGLSYVEMLTDGGGTHFAQVQDSERAFRNCHGPALGARECTIILLAGIPTDAASYTLLDNHQATTTNVGLTIQRTVTNRIQVFVSNGGGAVCNHTTSASADLVAADGIQAIGWRVSGNAVQINVGAAAEEGFTCTGGGSSADATNELTIGGSAALTGTSNLHFGGLLIFDRSLSDVEYAAVVTDLRAQRRASASWLMEVSAANGYYNFRDRHLDFTNPTTLWSDTAATTQVSTLNTRIRNARDPNDLVNSWSRQGTSTVTDAPIWVTDRGAEWSGANAQALVWNSWKSRGGAVTWIMEVEQDRTTTGSNVLVGSNYASVGGPDYVANPGGLAQYTVHPVTGAATTADLEADGVGWQVIQSTRNGASWAAFVDNGGTGVGTNATAFTPTSIGRESVDDWRLDGRVRRLLKWNATLSSAQRQRVVDAIAADDATPAYRGYYPLASINSLTAPGQAVVGRPMTATGAGSPFSVVPSPDTGCSGTGCWVETGIDAIFCVGCTPPTATSQGLDYFQLVSGTGAIQSAFLGTDATTRVFNAAAGFIVEACMSKTPNALGSRGAILMLGSAFDSSPGAGCTGTFEPRCLVDGIGYAHNSGDSVATGWRFVNGRNTSNAVTGSAPFDGRTYCATISVEDGAGASTGYALLLDMTDPNNPVIADERTFSPTGTNTTTRFLEVNSSPGVVSGDAQTMRVYGVRGALSYAP